MLQKITLQNSIIYATTRNYLKVVAKTAFKYPFL